jgi:hypothetical protein
MAYQYHNDLLAPYLALPQGDKIQAECEIHLLSYRFQQKFSHANLNLQTSGLMAMAVFVQRPRSVIANDCRSSNLY